MMLLPLKKPKTHPNWKPVYIWKKSKPFVINTRGKLIHRPVQITNHKCGDRPIHIAIHYHCGGCVTGDSGHLKLVDDLDNNDVVCEKCEDAAIEAGKPSSQEILGRHVHIGGIEIAKLFGC